MRGKAHYFPSAENQDLGRLMLHAADVRDVLRCRTAIQHGYQI